MALLLYPPYFRALYFPKEQLLTFLFTLALFGLWWIQNWRSGDLRFFRSPLDYFALAAALAWTVSIFGAVNPRGALQEALKNLNYFLIYWLVAEQIRSKHSLIHGNVKPILGGMYLSALGVALMGLGAAAGVVHYNGAFQGGRIYSTIQYPNSLAAYLTAAFFVGLGLWISNDWSDAKTGTVANLWSRMRTGAFSSSLAVILLTFIFTLSRGAWLVFPISALLFLVLTPSPKRLQAGSHFAGVVLATLAASPLMLKGISASSSTYVGLGTLVALIGGIAMGYAAEFYQGQSLRWKVAVPAALVVVSVITGGAYFALVTLRPLTLSHSPQERDSWKLVEQQLSGLEPGRGHVLTLEVNASGDAKKTYAWRVAVIGYDASAGTNETLANVTGKPAAGWRKVQVNVKVPPGFTHLSLQLINYYSDTTVTFRNVAVASTDGVVEARPRFTLSRLLPFGLYQRVSDIGLSASSSESRLTFYGDALKIVRDYPILGTGGGGWAAAFTRYQSYGYISREVHNHFLQTWVETGTLGFLAWLALWVAFLYLGCRRVRGLAYPANVLLAGILTGAITIGIHSSIDFNLSLPAISLYLWALMGASVDGGTDPKHAAAPQQPPAVLALMVPLVSALALAVLTFRLLAGYVIGAQAATWMKQGVAGAAVAYERAIAYDPWTASFHVDLGQLTGSPDEVNRGVNLDPYNPQYKMTLGLMYLRRGDVQRGLANLNEALALEPFQQQAYEQVAQADYTVGEALFRSDRQSQGRPILQEVLNLSARLDTAAASISPTVPQAYRLRGDSATLALVIGKAQALLGIGTEAENRLLAASKNDATAADANIWLAALYTSRGDTQKAGAYQARIKDSEAERRYADALIMLRQANQQ